MMAFSPRAFSFALIGAAVASTKARQHSCTALAGSKKQLIVVKLGGSAITVKNKLETLNENALDATAAHIALATKSGDIQLAVLHGAGSFGHFQAKKFLISKGDSHPQWALGFADTRRAVTTLNLEVVSRLVRASVPAVGLSPFPTSATASKLLHAPGTMDQVKATLDAGLVPVVHGDAVFDAKQGSAIMSGDLILDYLCSTLKPSAAVFLTDVPGVFTKPPGQPGAQLIPKILVSSDGRASLPEMSTAEHDVTGGIEEKLRTAISVVVKCNIPVYIVQVGTQHAADALSGKVPKVATALERG
mmetsp:Transcript_45875/g.92579  ORF Transcript_45875/g.92579 Transcript_45875/m.92579 type:complete len:303 (+) Transcript_45875:68-976(+)